MGLRDILFGSSTNSTTTTYDLKTIRWDLSVEVYYKKLAIDTCINLIANALVRSKFRTFEQGKEITGSNYYLFNVQPNQNQNSTQFIHELVSKLVYDNECLAVMQNDQLYIADSYDITPYALKENAYKDVVINNYKLDKTFYESEVFYFKLNNERITSVIDSLYGSYGKLLASSMNYYKRSNALKSILKMGTTTAQTDEEQAMMDELFNTQFANFFNSDGDAVLPLQEGLELVELEKFKSTGQTSRDIRSLVNDIFEFVAIAFHVPKGLLMGDLADVNGQTDNFIMFCVNPIAELLNDEINRKFYTKEEYLKRTYLKVDTSLIKYVDPVALANACDIYFRIGVNTINDNLRMIGREPIEDPIGDKRFVTKNYQDEQTMQAASKGGGN